MKTENEQAFINSVRPLFWQRRLYRFVTIVGVIMFMASRTAEAWLWLLLSVPLTLIALVWSIVIEMRLEKRVWQRFAEGLTDVQSTTGQQFDSPAGVIGSIGDERWPQLLVNGHYGSYEVRLWQQTSIFNPDSSKHRTSLNYRILEIATKQDFYHVFIDSKSNSRGVFTNAMVALSRSVRDNQKLTVEGDVNKYFDIYVPSGDDYRSLVTLTPEKLLALRDYGKDFDVEFVNNKIYVISRSNIRNVTDVLTYQTEAFELLGAIGTNLVRTRTDIDSTIKVKQPVTIGL
jgi:hypothetical protein